MGSCLGNWSRYCIGIGCPVETDCRQEVFDHTPPKFIGKKLNLGAAKDIKPYSEHWINADIGRAPGIDVSFDFNQRFPFDDSEFEYIWASHIFEHLTNFPGAVKECARVLKKGGLLEVYAPYGVGYHSYDPFHVRYFFENAFDYFCRGENGNTTLETDWEKPLFKIEKTEVLRILPHRELFSKILGKRVAGRYTFPLGIKVELHWVLRRL
jgi:SAM-dependent methyltransferase